MTTNIAKIRAALEQAGEYIRSDLASERGAFEGHEGVSRIDEIKVDLANNASALAALAELERAAATPVAWMWDDMLGISHTYVSPKRPTWPDAGASPEMAVAINVRPLYAAPPAPVAPQFVAGEIDQRTFKNAYHRALNRIIEISEKSGSNATIAEQAREWLAAWRSELGSALGLVEIREPTDDECRDIWREAKANEGDGSKVCAGRAMFDAVRAVLWPKEGL